MHSRNIILRKLFLCVRGAQAGLAAKRMSACRPTNTLDANLSDTTIPNEYNFDHFRGVRGVQVNAHPAKEGRLGAKTSI
jgi:hypothetical protein